tara:strand:- start:826 stop:1002 length:177 start_codon:yes stop_codon:yes gene_type:complete
MMKKFNFDMYQIDNDLNIYQKIIIEMSFRLADEEDFEEDIEPKLQHLLNHFNKEISHA